MKLRVRKWVYQLTFFAVLIAVVASTLGALRKQDVELQRAQSRRENLLIEKQDAERKLQGMDRLLEYTKSDAYTEQKARQIFGWVRPDEYLFVEDDVLGAASPTIVVEAQNAYREAAELERSVEAEALGIEWDVTPVDETPENDPNDETNPKTDLDDAIAENMPNDANQTNESNGADTPVEPENTPAPTPMPERNEATTDVDLDDIAAQFGIPDENN